MYNLVATRNLQVHEELTEQLSHPHTEASDPDFARRNNRFAQMEVVQTPHLQHALLIAWRKDASALVYIVLSVVLLSILAGTLVGTLTRNSELGVVACSGSAAILSCIQGILIWHFRTRE